MKVADDELVTYDALSSAIGRDVRKSARGNLATARRMAESEGRVFAAVLKVGLKRLTAQEICTAPGEQMVRRVHGLARRTNRKLACVGAEDFKKLTREEQTDLNSHRSLAGLLHHVTKPSEVKRVVKKVSEASGELAIGRVLELFK